MTTDELVNRMSLEVDQVQKEMMTDGLYPYSPLWPMAKIAAIRRLGKKYNLKLVLEPAEEKALWFKLFLLRFRLFRNYKFIIFLNNILNLKKYIKRYLIIDGHKFWVKSSPKMNEIVNDYLSLNGKIWEEQTTKIVKQKVKRGMTCVDIGASVGYFTLLFARQVGKTGRVISIEPADFQQPYIKRNVKVNGYEDRVKIIHAGAWDKEEITYQPRNAPEYVQTVLRCRPVDDILGELGIREVDFIKLDVDGPEPKVLKGLERTIQRSPNLQMVAEYYPKYIRDAGLNPQDMLDFLNKYFNYYVIPGDYEDGCWNYFCVRKYG